MCRVIWLVVFQMCFFDFTLWFGMSVFSWLTLKFIIIWHGVAQPRFLGIQEAGSREGQPQPVWWLIKSIVPTSDWLQFWGLFKIFFFWCLLFIFFVGVQVGGFGWFNVFLIITLRCPCPARKGCSSHVAADHPATPGRCWIHELLGVGTGYRPRSRIHEIIGCTLPRGISSTKTTSHAGETDTT